MTLTEYLFWEGGSFFCDVSFTFNFFKWKVTNIYKKRKHGIMNPHVPTTSFSQNQQVASLAASLPLAAPPLPQSIVKQILDLKLVYL